MSETASRIRLIVGGRGLCRFAVDLDQVERIEGHAQVAFPHRSVNVPLLFDLAPARADEDRYALVRGRSEASYLRLGPTLDLQSHPADHFSPVPPSLALTAARWGWAGLAISGEHAMVLVDAYRLAMLGARSGMGEAESTS